ncbi:MAG: flagellar protein FlbD [Chloroflexi bacterium]|nr:MAG: flagellar protein FlbD [Chloroflexota bacterium]RLT46802.1 MAG: flagellar protein FlbD [Chloroflexota bacterium]RLT46877.1 MAG: flagellar protein FlbD [Chloroflexota bacterium]RLT53451.1 MAG: flagellar protein FlbD [Chloroflexota bacterium]
MIRVTRFDGSVLFINANAIKSVQAAPDTIITLLNDQDRFMVREARDVVIQAILTYQRYVHQPLSGDATTAMERFILDAQTDINE